MLIAVSFGRLFTSGLRLGLALHSISAVGSSVSASVSRRVLVLGEGGRETKQSGPDTGGKVMSQTVLRDLLFLESDALLPLQLL